MPKAKSLIESHKIKHILFDLGGVLLNIDYTLTEKAFAELGIVDFDLMYSQAKQDGLFDRFEKGEIGRGEFIGAIQRISPSSVNRDEIETAWNAMLLNFPSERLDMLSTLNKTHDVYLLSNTNEIHFGAFNMRFEKAFDRSFSPYFRKDYYSHQLGMRKPDAEVFEFIVKDQGLIKQEILFIDDSEQHVKGAKSLGIPSILLEKNDDVISLLRRLHILA
jgi:putative hydrolase of the HAD superfamily